MTEIRLSEQDRAFVEREIGKGSYRTPEEVVSAGLQRLGSEDEMLRQMIAEADAQIARGEYKTFTSADELIDSIIERGMQRLDKKS